MAKRTLSLVLTGILISSVLSLAPVGAQEAPAITEVPEVVQITDPAYDANFTAEEAENVSNVGDLLNVWFTNDAETITVHVNTLVAPPSSTSNIMFSVFANPQEGATGTASCLRFSMIPVGTKAAYQGDQIAKLQDRCNEEGLFFNDGVGVEGELEITELADGTGLMSATFPRSYSDIFADAESLTSPLAYSYMGGGSDQTYPHNGNRQGFSGLSIDWTEVGTDYTITAGGDGGPVAKEPKKSKKDKKKNCNKIKNKKKKKACKKQQKKNNPPAGRGCAAYQPGELGAEAETTVVTDEATEEAPIEIEVPIGPALGSDLSPLGLYDLTDRVAHNVQVDTGSDEAGLYIRLESPEIDDPDLYVYWDNGTEAAVAGGFNLTPVGPFDGTGSGGHSGVGFEQIDGLRTADCVGYDLDLVNWLGVGGTYTLKLWLGEIQNDPAPRDG